MTLPELVELRNAIDEVDHEILDLLRKRLTIVLKVGEIKRQKGVRVYDPERERSVLERLGSDATAPLRSETAKRIFERIIDESRSQEQHHVAETKAPPENPPR